MSRLTIKVNEEKCIEKGICYLPKDHNSCVFDVLNKLGEWEDLEEQGRLIEQKHGRWKPTGNIEVLYAKEYACSVCGGIMLGKSEFCPDCGAKMEELKGTEE